VDAFDQTYLLRGFAWARLVVAGLLLTAATLLSRLTVPAINPKGFGAAVLIIAASSAAILALRPRLVPTRSVASLLLGLDVVTVTFIVLMTGGPESIFAFLYVLIIIASCVLLSRPGALAIAGAASLLYTAVVVGRTIVPVSYILDAATETTALEVMTMFMNTGTFLVVAITAGSLAEHYRSAHHALEDQRKDLSDLQAFKDLIFQSVGAGLIALDGGGRITAYNLAAAEMTGVAAARAIGEPWSVIFGSGVNIAETLAAIENDPRACRRYELNLRRASGMEVPAAITFWALRSGSGETVGLIAVCEDLSSIKQMEARVRQADRLATVGRMAANIAHEIRNPLASLTGAIEVLARDAGLGGTRERLAQIVVRESERLDHIIRDLLDYARPAPLTLQPINLADTLDEVLLLLEHRPLPDTVKIARAYDRELAVDADPQQIRQVFWNLCLNALEAMPEGGELHVAARRQDRFVLVQVSDSGQGIQAADLPHIFEPFFSTKSEGSGIGLALVHRIVQEHGGDIEVRDHAGPGTTFIITLPARDA
jgi:two-component system, NtrC family, sensor histidine kinase PilS